MATIEEVANTIDAKRQIARNLQHHAWYMKTVRESDAYDIGDYELVVAQGLYRHRGRSPMKDGGILQGQSLGRTVVYKVVNKSDQELAPEKTFDVAVFIKDNLPFEKLILDFDEFSPSNRMGVSIILEVPDVPESYEMGSYSNTIESMYNGEILSQAELVEVLGQAGEGFGPNVPPGSADANGKTVYHHQVNQHLNGPGTVYDGSNGKIPPGNLTQIGPPGATTNGIGALLLRSDYAENWFAMKAAAAADGITLTATSAYRSYDYQAQAYREHGAGYVIARPGQSNHGFGTAVDISLAYGDATWKWLVSNAGRFGFRNTLGSKDPVHWSQTGR